MISKILADPRKIPMENPIQKSGDHRGGCMISKKLGLVFPIFSLLAVKFGIFDLRFGFLVKNCIYSQQGMSRMQQYTLKNKK